MKVIIRANLLVVCACLALGLGLEQRVSAAETNSAEISASPTSDKTAQDLLNAYFQIQAQLHATQLAIENNRQEAAAEAKRNTDEMAARIHLLEQTIAAQRVGEIQATQKAQRLTLILAGAFGVAGLAAMLLMAFLQWRVVTRLVASPTVQSPAAALGAGQPLAMLPPGEGVPGRAAVQLSNTRLLNVVESLEKRIFELEKTGHGPLEEFNLPAVHEPNGAATALSDRDECIANLLAEGQSLLDENNAGKALECFDEALALQPGHPGTLIKKGGALEKLSRFDEAIACYDSAIEADNSMTIAYLHKGGLFNRLSRYEEALQCYEYALHTHQKPD